MKIENYQIEIQNGKLAFLESATEIADLFLRPEFNKQVLDLGYRLCCRLGDPALMHCIVYRKHAGSHAIFVMFEHGQCLYTASADSNLIFSMGLGYFGELCANTRYGVDIFEELDELDE